MRIQKFLASKGHGSRREVERWVKEGRLKINGKKAQIGDAVKGDELFFLDSQRLYVNPKKLSHQHIIYNKNNDEICSRSDPDYKKSVFDSLPKIRSMRWVMVGRLDVSTTGLLLFTTDGELANRLMHPSYEIIRHYAVRIYGHPSKNDIISLLKGVELDDGPAAFISVKKKASGMANVWYEVTLAEGRKHEVKRLWEAVGFKVNKLIRLGYGEVTLPKSLRRGSHQKLSADEIKRVYQSVKLTDESISKNK